MKLAIRLVAAVLFAGVAYADTPPETGTAVNQGETITVASSSAMAVAEDYLVLPDGAEVAGSLRTITADGGLGSGRIGLTDVALFDAHLVWAIARRYELDATASVLAKQPSATSEDILQGGSLTLRRAFNASVALAVSGGASPLIDLRGLAYDGSLFASYKKRLSRYCAFMLAAGGDTTVVHATNAVDTAAVVEGAAHADVLVRADDVWGGWLGAGYAIPAYHHGHDPVSEMPLDPQPRLDVDFGTSVQLNDDWYLSADLTIMDRGDLANPATRLPVLDGGFDQIQIMVEITRRIRGRAERDRYRDAGVNQPPVQL